MKLKKLKLNMENKFNNFKKSFNKCKYKNMNHINLSMNKNHLHNQPIIIDNWTLSIKHQHHLHQYKFNKLK